jgi:L-threonylcarbamoyladenylate synthase
MGRIGSASWRGAGLTGPRSTWPASFAPRRWSNIGRSTSAGRVDGRHSAVTTFRYVRPASRSGLLRLADLEVMVDILKNDGLVVLPTETGYLVAAVGTSRDAVRKVFSVKDRDLSNVMHLAFASLEMASRYAVLTERAKRILGALTPGPITVVVEQTDQLPDDLVTLNGTVGIRIPDAAATLQVIAALGFPVTATSLNRAGEEAAGIERDQLETLNWPAGDLVGVVVVDQPAWYSQPSTLARVIGDVEILRKGPIGESEILDVVGGREMFPSAGRAAR